VRPAWIAAAILCAGLIHDAPAAAQPGTLPRARASDLRVSFIDVGQGDAIWIRTPPVNGVSKSIVIDGGPDEGGANRVVKYLSAYGLPPGSIIDFVIVSHPHDDHYPGLLDLMRLYRVRTIIHPGFPKPGEYAEFLSLADAEIVDGQHATVVNLRNTPAFKMDWGQGVSARILYADSASATGMGSGNTRQNNASTVIRMQFGDMSFLFMGDAEGKDRDDPPANARFVESMLLKTLMPGDLKATVLKAGHHASETGSTLPFITAVRPDVVVVMSGRRTFGGRFLPDDTTLDRYAEVNPNVIIVRTDERDEEEGRTAKDDQDGDDIYMRTDGKVLRIYQAVGPNKRRVWHRVAAIP
jgi:beta-lactamase superfamily II metal-dependent hydrolase